MLEIKLKEARKKTSATRMAFFGIATATVLVVVLSIVSINLYRDLETIRGENEASISPSLQEKSNHKQLRSTQQVVLNIQSEEESAIDEPTKTKLASSHMSVVPTKTLNVPPSNKSITKKTVTSKFSETIDLEREPVIQSSPTIEKTEDDRRLFRSELKKFGSEIAPIIKSPSFKFWNQERQQDILFLRDQAVASFGNGEFNQGLVHVRKASEIGKLELIDMENAYQSAMEMAQRDKKSDSYETAILNIERALALKPSSQPAQRLAADIAKLPEVLKWL